MAQLITVFSIAALFCQVQSQICVSQGPAPVISSAPFFSNAQLVTSQALSPVAASPVVATTIVDNSVSTALANALQLLIVSDLIESRSTRTLLNGIGPIVDTVVPEIVDVVAPCLGPLNVFAPCAPPVIDTCIPNIFRGVTETITPNIFGGYTESIRSDPYGITETITPNCYGGWTETVTPNLCRAEFYGTTSDYPNIATVTPNIYGGVTEIVSSAPCAPQLPVFSGFKEIITSPCGPNYYNNIAEFNTPYGPNCYGTEIVSNSFNPGCLGGITEVISGNPYSPNYYGNVEILSQISPCNTICNGLPEVVTPSFSPYYGGPLNSGCLGGVSEVISNQFIPNYIGGVKEVFAPTNPFAPVAAEVLVPSSVPAQLKCNFGYMSKSAPCVSVNVEALPFDVCGCGCNGHPQGLFY